MHAARARKTLAIAPLHTRNSSPILLEKDVIVPQSCCLVAKEIIVVAHIADV